MQSSSVCNSYSALPFFTLETHSPESPKAAILGQSVVKCLCQGNINTSC